MKVSDLREGGIYIDIAGPEILKFVAKESETRCKFLVLDGPSDPYEVSLLDSDIESDLLEYPRENFNNLLLNTQKESERCSTD